MEKLKLYNWYGEEFENKIPQKGTTLKAYKKSAKNIYNRRIRSIQQRKNIEKDLFLRAKTKIQDNLKRELYSHKVAYLNKVKVVKDSIKKLKIASSVENLIKFEISKLIKDRRYLNKYAKDYQISLKNTTDTYEEKVNSITNLIQKTNQEQNQLNLKFIFYTLMLQYLKKNNDLDFDFNKLNNLLDVEKEFLNSISNPKEVFTNAYDEIKKTQQRLLLKKQELQTQFNQEKKLLKNNYKNGKYNIKLSARKRIISAEYEYNQKYEESKAEAKEYKKEFLNKISEHKAKILSAEKNNSKIFGELFSKSNDLKRQYQLNYKNNLKNVKAKTLKYMFGRFEKFTKLENSLLLNLNLNLVETMSIKSIKKSILSSNNLTKVENEILKIYLDSFFSIKNYYEYTRIVRLIIKSNYTKGLSESFAKVSYESDYQLVKSNALIEKAQALNELIEKFLIEKIQAKVEILKLKLDQKIQTEKQSNKIKRKEIISSSKSILAEYKKKIKSKEITKAAFKNKKIEIKVDRKEKLLELKLNSNWYKNKNVLSTNFWRENAEKSIANKIYESKINEAQKSIPIEVNKNLKVWATILGFILPGLPELILFKQYIKGILMMLFTIFLWSFLVPFSMGLYWSKMNGIPGFYDLGAGKFNSQAGIFPDARYYLFGGIVSIIFFSISLIYLFISSIGAKRVATALEEGLRPSKWSHTKRYLNTNGFPWMISIFGWFLMAFIVVAPIFTSILISFTDYGYLHEAPMQPVHWVGLKQWGLWWQQRKNDLLLSLSRVLGWSVIWTIFSTILPISLGIILAVIANNKRIKGKKIFRLIFILPWGIPAFVTLSFLRKSFMAGDTGYINFILMNLHFIDRPIDWLNDINKARVLVILVQTWIAYAWIFMLVTGNLQSIPKDIYEAGSIDGAKSGKLFWNLTLPLLLLSIAPMLIGQFVGAFNNFTTISLFTGGGPAFAKPTVFLEASTDIVISWVYKITTGVVKFESDQAFAAALTTLAAIFSVAIAAHGFIKSMTRRD